MKLTERLLSTMSLAKVYQDNTKAVNYGAFSKNGELFVTSSDDESIRVYDCLAATPKKMLYSKKYGVSHIQFTHAANTVLHTSTKADSTPEKDNTVRYLSLHDNRYLRYFAGHAERVTDLKTSPTDDTFLSGSHDGTVRRWDLRTPHCQGLLHIPRKCHVALAYDPRGDVFMVGVDATREIKLYDCSSADKGPFSTLKIPGLDHLVALEVSPDGERILVSTRGRSHYLLDAFKGEVKASYEGHMNAGMLPLRASFSPDGNFVISGSQTGKLHIWNSATGTPVHGNFQAHPSETLVALFNPAYAMLASACTNVGFWIPATDQY